MKVALLIASALCVGAAISTAASAERIPAYSSQSKAAFAACNAGGGKTIATFNGKNQITSCITNDAHGVVCGGVTKEQQKTCDTFRQEEVDARRGAVVSVPKPIKHR